MKKPSKHSIIVRDAFHLAKELGLSRADAVTMDFRARLNFKIVSLVKQNGITHNELAKRANASRTRVTAILNGQTEGVSTDFLLRVLYALGCKTRPVFSSAKRAA